MTFSPTVTVTNLNHSFGQGTLQKPVLTDIDLVIYPGEIVILTGPSGSGKTTLLSLIGGLRSVQKGSLKIFNQELKGCTKKQLIQIRNQIGFIFQHHNLLKCLTAYGNVRMSLKLHPEISKYEYRQKAVAILDAVGLGDHVDYYPEKLSGGQKQRVAIARALVAQPKLVLADEPTSSLDSKTGRDVVDIIQRLAQEEGCSVLLVTHDARILDIADRIIQMEDGRLQDDN
ncbi:DevA family ABC transporter ATP-binding protein [Halotia branconii]|uniref:DevA family ABC transporter ATP-binding protein n=1 Tax=Halotia branconii CENA392 TaxID=1539056 RepID=A0AAJ6NMK9_9CYAN|nr:DevA family ABC transporter ATP-binding protein [Halotia branconii]WGV23181.1 DevA family ABC transporter ATP-binding protein [Halotia branconii CENA392]